MSEIVYTPKDKDPNGILIVLREAHKAKDDEDEEAVLKGNRDWIKDVLQTEKRDNQKGRYRNRFIDMLKSVGRDEGKLPLITFANINSKGGGASASKDYNNLSDAEKIKILDGIVDEVKPKIVFLIWDVFRAKFQVEKLPPGLVYGEKSLRVTIDNKTTFCEIYHPAAPVPKIDVGKSKNNIEKNQC